MLHLRIFMYSRGVSTVGSVVHMVVRRRRRSPFRVPRNIWFAARCTDLFSFALIHPATPQLQSQEVLASQSYLQRRPCGRRAPPRPGCHSSFGLASHHADVPLFAVRSDAVGIDDQGPPAQVLDVVVLGNEIEPQQAPSGMRRGQAASGSLVLTPRSSVPYTRRRSLLGFSLSGCAM